MGKKKPEEMAKQRDIFTKGALERGIEEKTATYIFDLMEKFAGYGFNKSHSAAYALVSYQTAWMKTHYPAAFMAAVLSADMDNTDKVVTLIDECADMKLTVEPPDVNLCEHRFTVRDDSSIVYGLGAIKGVGESAIEAIVEERKSNGQYSDLFDFCQRVDLKKVNRRTFEALIMAGAMDTFKQNRATLMASLPSALRIAEKVEKDKQHGIVDMFGMSPQVESSPAQYVVQNDWSEDQRLSCEKQTLGLYLTGHPIDRYLAELGQFTTARIVNLKPSKDQTVVVAGLVIAMRTMNTKRGDKMAFVTLDDRSGRIEMAVFSEPFQRYRDLIAKDKLIVVEGEVSVDDYSGGYKMSARSIYDMDQARENFAHRVLVDVDEAQAANGFINNLKSILAPYREGFCNVELRYHRSGATAEIVLGQEWRIRPTDECLHRLREMAGDDRVNVDY